MTRFGLGRRTSSPTTAWDDSGAEPFVHHVADLARSADPAPGDALVTGARSAMLTAFARASAAAALATGTPRRQARPRFAWALVAASALGLAAVAGAVASTPGGPLYDVRVAAETIGLPDAPIARERAQAVRLEARIRDVEAAATNADAAGVRASLEAFQQIATGAAATAVPDDVAAASLQAVLEQLAHVPAGDAETLAALERTRVAGEGLLRALRGPGSPGGGEGPVDRTPAATEAPRNSHGPAASPSPAPSPVRGSGSPGRSDAPRGSGAPGGDGGGNDPGSGSGGSGGSAGSGGSGSGAGASGAPSGSGPGSGGASGSGGGSGSRSSGGG